MNIGFLGGILWRVAIPCAVTEATGRRCQLRNWKFVARRTSSGVTNSRLPIFLPAGQAQVLQQHSLQTMKWRRWGWSGNWTRSPGESRAGLVRTHGRLARRAGPRATVKTKSAPGCRQHDRRRLRHTRGWVSGRVGRKRQLEMSGRSQLRNDRQRSMASPQCVRLVDE